MVGSRYFMGKNVLYELESMLQDYAIQSTQNYFDHPCKSIT